MRVVLALLIVALAYVNAKPTVTSEQCDKFEEIIKNCKSKHKDVSDEDIGLLWQTKIPISETGKCFACCINKGMGILDTDSKVNMKRVTELMEHVKDKAEYVPMMKIFETCAAEVSGDHKCISSTKLMECNNRELKAAGIKDSYMKILFNIKI